MRQLHIERYFHYFAAAGCSLSLAVFLLQVTPEYTIYITIALTPYLRTEVIYSLTQATALMEGSNVLLFGSHYSNGLVAGASFSGFLAALTLIRARELESRLKAIMETLTATGPAIVFLHTLFIAVFDRREFFLHIVQPVSYIGLGFVTNAFAFALSTLLLSIRFLAKRRLWEKRGQ